ncbi:MAG: hypothetical protein SNH94_02140 [Rikenellaceae bacterium]
MKEFCESCGAPAHDFEKEEAFSCIPPKNVLRFGKYLVNKEYREALYNNHPYYTSEEIVGSYLGKNPYFPSERDWIEKQCVFE